MWESVFVGGILVISTFQLLLFNFFNLIVLQVQKCGSRKKMTAIIINMSQFQPTTK